MGQLLGLGWLACPAFRSPSTSPVIFSLSYLFLYYITLIILTRLLPPPTRFSFHPVPVLLSDSLLSSNQIQACTSPPPHSLHSVCFPAPHPLSAFQLHVLSDVSYNPRSSIHSIHIPFMSANRTYTTVVPEVVPEQAIPDQRLHHKDRV